MSAKTDVSSAENRVRAARTKVEQDIEALDSEIRADRAAAKARLRSNAIVIVSGAAAVGLLVGFGGKKAVKVLLGAGLAAGAMVLCTRKHASA